MAAKWADREDHRLQELHAAGKSIGAIATELGRSKSTVARRARSLGLSFDRSRSAKAAEALKIDNKARRARIEERLLATVEACLDQLDDQHLVYSFGGAENVYREHYLDRPDAGATRSLIQAASTALTAANKLHDMSTDQRDLPAVDAWLDAMTGGT